MDKRRVVFYVSIGLILFFGFFTKNLRMDNSVSIWFLDDDPAFMAYKEFQDKFGNDDVVTLFFSSPEGIFTRENLSLVHQVSDALAGISWVDRVISLSHVKYLAASGEESLVLEDLYAEAPETEEEVAGIRKRAASWPALESLLVSPDRKGTLIMAELKVIDNIDAIRGQIIEEVEEAIQPAFSGAEKAYRMGGIGVIYNALNQAAIMDSAVFSTLSYVVIFFCLILFLASLPFTLLAMAAIFLAMTLTLGVFAFAGNSINMVTMILPTLIMVIGIADMVHILVHYARVFQTQASMTREEAIRDTISHLAAPCLLTTVTTSLGFLALASSPMAVIRQFGLYAALGVLVALGLTFVLAAFFCVRISRPGDKPTRPLFEKAARGMDRFLEGMAGISTRHPGTVIILSVFLVLLACWGIRSLEANTYPVRYLNEKDPVRISHHIIERDFGHFVPLEFTVRAANAGVVKTPGFLDKIKAFQERLAEDPQIRQSFSVVDIVEFLNQSFAEGKPEAYRIPRDRASVEQLLLFYEMDPNNDLEEWIGPDYREVRITAYTITLSANEYGELVERAKSIFRDMDFGEDLVEGEGLRPDGYLPLYVVMNQYILSSQVRSFLIAFLLVFGLLGVIFRSFRLLLLCLFPNLLPPLFVLGFMGFTGITLDIGTVMIAAILLGIVVDDTVHFLYRFRREGSREGDLSSRIRAALMGVGPAIVATSVILSVGFLILSLASIQSIANFGILCALAILFALFSDLLLLPSLLKKFYR